MAKLAPFALLFAAAAAFAQASGPVLELHSPEPGLRFGSVLAVGDVTHDGKVDLIVAAPSPSGGRPRTAAKLFIYRGGAPLSQPNHVVPLSFDSRLFTDVDQVVVVGDQSGDGAADLAVSDHRTGAVRIGLVRGQSATSAPETFGSPIDVAPQGFGGAVASGDVDHDGQAELLLGTTTKDARGMHSALLAWSSAHQKTWVSKDEQPFGAESVGVGDLNGDGAADFVVSDAFRDRLLFFSGSLDAAPVAVSLSGAAGGAAAPRKLWVTDVDADNLDDVVACGPRGFTVVHGNRKAVVAPTPEEAIRLPVLASGPPRFSCAVLKSRDGVRVAFGSPGDGKVWVSPLHGGPAVELAHPPTLGEFGAAVATGDFTGDGVEDVVVGAPADREDVQQSAVYVYSGAGLGTGAVAAAVLPKDPADPAEVRRALESNLLAFNLAAAAQVAAKVPQDAPHELLALAAATVAADDPALARSLKKRAEFAPPALPVLPPDRPAPASGAAYVNVASAAVRASPVETAALVDRLPIATRVTVVGVSGDFLKVDAAPPSPRYAGYIRKDLLAGQKPEVDALLKAATSRSAAQDATSATTLLWRAVALAPGRDDVQRPLVDQALKSQQYDLAVNVVAAATGYRGAKPLSFEPPPAPGFDSFLPELKAALSRRDSAFVTAHEKVGFMVSNGCEGVPMSADRYLRLSDRSSPFWARMKILLDAVPDMQPWTRWNEGTGMQASPLVRYVAGADAAEFRFTGQQWVLSSLRLDGYEPPPVPPAKNCGD